ncbi:MAG: hypothetical protein KC416_06110 [Myxococcales bacterium]|nr:hypothetical protein [Myxococcales bacterium]
MHRVVIVALSVFTLSAVVGCGASREAAWDTTAATPKATGSEGDREALLSAAAAAWEARSDEAQLKTAIAKLEQASSMAPEDVDTLVQLARAYYFLGDGHMSFDENRLDEMITTFEKGTQAAERALIAGSPEFAKKMRAGTRIEEAVAILGKDSVPALYWRSANMGKWGLAKGFATILSYKDEIRAVMARCLELDPTYNYAGPHRYFGAYYAKLPAFAGGDLEKSSHHFKEALRIAPTNLATRTLYAELNAVKAQDRKLFDEQIKAILEADLDADPAIRPENAVEQRRAKALQAEADDLFE